MHNADNMSEANVEIKKKHTHNERKRVTKNKSQKRDLYFGNLSR